MIITSILILTYNAPRYVRKTLKTLNRVIDPSVRAATEVVVLDNASDEKTRKLLRKLHEKKYIDKLHFSGENTFFARGNNLAFAMSDPGSRYVLLLNSDVKIKKPDWLSNLIARKEAGGYAAASYGATSGARPLADGYCLLLDRALYDKYKLDEYFQWWGGVTKLEADLLRDGHSILALDNHDEIVYHYGGKSKIEMTEVGDYKEQYKALDDAFANTKGRLVIESVGKPASSGCCRKITRKCKKIIDRVRRR